MTAIWRNPLGVGILMGDVYVQPVPEALGGDVNKPVIIQRPPPRRDEIAAWEAENGRLPDDYIAFMMAHNGGTLYPATFRHNVIDPPDFLDLEAEASIDLLYTWDKFVKANGYLKIEWRIDHVMIGYDNTSSRILISLRTQDFGAVRYWPRNVADWDEDADGPPPVGNVAPTFRDFIFTALHENEDRIAPRWYIPRDLETATKVAF